MMPSQRLRIAYGNRASGTRPGGLRHVWLDAFARAGLSLAHPAGSRRVRMELGPPLPEGASGERELLDVWLEPSTAPQGVLARLAEVLPTGLEPLDAEEIGERLPSLQASLRAAQYVVTFDAAAVD